MQSSEKWEEQKINKELWVFAFCLPRGKIFPKLILILRNHFSGDNPQTTSPSDFTTERDTNHFLRSFMHRSTALMNKDVHHGTSLQQAKIKFLCPGGSFPFEETHSLQTLILVTMLHFSPYRSFFFFKQTWPQPATHVIWFYLLQSDLIYSHMFYSCVVFIYPILSWLIDFKVFGISCISKRFKKAFFFIIKNGFKSLIYCH